MGYKIGLWYSRKPVNVTDAGRHYSELIEGSEFRSNSNKIDALLEELSKDFPEPKDLKESSNDTSPWRSNFVVTGDGVILNLTKTSVPETVQYVKNIGEKHNVVVFDPQENKVYLPLKLEYFRQLPYVGMLFILMMFIWYAV